VKQAMQRLIQFAESRGDLPIEFHAREATSYAAIMHSAELLEQLGYRITVDHLIEDYFEEAEGDDRNVHLIRLEKIQKFKKAA